ncbi:MAG: hypothetical protein D6689_15980 [Deltaproteobacteria bacterium]|nr:MAG: hypothetical protein D6689_15980 [Deltaproteobacteria bacterium]
MTHACRSVDRVHLLAEDLDWAPRAFAWLHRGVAATIVAGASIPALIEFGPVAWFVPGLVAPVASRVGNRAARALARRRLARVARGEVDLARLDDERDGAVVRVRGTVDATDTLPGLVADEPTVYRRVQLSLGSVQLVHEAAVDFAITDDAGRRVRVFTAGSRLLCAMPRQYLLSGPVRDRVLDEVRRSYIDALLRSRGVFHFDTMGDEYRLRPGDVVDVIGYKTRVVDPRGDRLARDNPFAAALRSGRRLPLLIVPAAAP